MAPGIAKVRTIKRIDMNLVARQVLIELGERFRILSGFCMYFFSFFRVSVDEREKDYEKEQSSR